MNVPAENPESVSDVVLSFADRQRYERYRAQCRGRHTGSREKWVMEDLAHRLRLYAIEHHYGWVFAAAGFDASPAGIVCRPDISAVRSYRVSIEDITRGHQTLAPDFVADIVSTDDNAAEVEAKVRDYRAAGVGLVWVIYPETRTASTHRPDRTGSVYSEDHVLPGEAVLPGFAVRLGDLFPPPRPTAATGGSP